jgi:WD40 repeat protein
VSCSAIGLGEIPFPLSPTCSSSATSAWYDKRLARAVWDETCSCISDALDHGPLRYFGGFDFAPDGRSLFVGNFLFTDRTLTAWDSVSWRKRWTVPITETPVDVIAARDAPWVATVYNAPAWLWDVETGVLVRKVGEGTPISSPLAALPGSRLLAGYRPEKSANSLSTWDTVTGQMTDRPYSIADGVRSLAVDRGCTRVATYAGDLLAMWDLSTGEAVHDFGGAHGTFPYGASTAALAFHPAGDRVIVSAVSGEAGPVVFDATTGRKMVCLPGVEPSSDAWAVAVSPCGKWLVAAFGWHEDDHWPWRDLTLRIWALDTGDLVETLDIPGVPLNRLVFSPDGALLVGGAVKAFHVWNVTR